MEKLFKNANKSKSSLMHFTNRTMITNEWEFFKFLPFIFKKIASKVFLIK